MRLCNFFRHHIQDFTIIEAPLFQLTRQDSGYQSWPLPDSALEAFKTLRTQLSKQPAIAFPRTDWDYLLIVEAHLPDQRPLHKSGPKKWQGEDSNHLSCIKTTKGEWEELHKVPPRDSCCRLGNGQLQWIPEWIHIYTIPRYHHRNNTRHHQSEDIEPPADNDERS